jgi:hypothetical protein
LLKCAPVASDAVLVKLDDISITLPMLPAAAFQFQMPPLPTQNQIQGVARPFFDAVEMCLGSTGGRPFIVEQLGITFVPNGSKVRLCSIDWPTVSFAQLPLPQLKLQDRAIVCADFCRQMLALAEQAHSTRLVLVHHTQQRSKKLRNGFADAPAGHALFLADDTLLFSRLLYIDGPRRFDFNEMFKAVVPADYAKRMVAIPQQLGVALKRSSLLANKPRQGEVIFRHTEGYLATEVAIEDGKATFRTRSPRGEISDTIQLPGHADITALVDVRWLLDHHAKFDKILFTDEWAILAKGDHVCVVGYPEVAADHRAVATSARSDSSLAPAQELADA